MGGRNDNKNSKTNGADGKSCRLPPAINREEQGLVVLTNELAPKEPARMLMRRLTSKLCRVCLLIVILITSTASQPALAAASVSASMPATLGRTQLLLASLLVTTTGGFTLWRRGLPQLAKQVVISCVRCSVQLYILGGVILHRLLGATHPGLLLAWIVGVGMIAAQQAFSRLDYVYDNLFSHLLISILGSVILVMGLSISTKMLGAITPWFAPSTTIPVSGMLFGSAISASSLAAKSLTREFAAGKAAVELRLARGATATEALRPLVQSSLSDALTPTINALAITGIVHMPGMMTGQILAGQSPQQAAAYQTLILFLIASTASISAQLLTYFVTHKLMDFESVRLLNGLKRKEGGDVEISSQTADDGRRFSLIRNGEAELFRRSSETTDVESMNVETFLRSKVKKLNTTDNSSSPVLTVDNLHVPRAGERVSLTVRQGDRIGIAGPSGSGKTQVLRTFAGLEDVQKPKSSLLLGSSSPAELSWPKWRRRVSWVSQDRPTLEGTPSMLFEELVAYQSQKKDQIVIGNPREIAQTWNLEPEAFDRSWETLSGGEAQRAFLAITMALKPQVLLLDEATSGLDESTQLLVEQSLIESEISIVMVTHSREQLQRFCTHLLELAPMDDTPLAGESGQPFQNI
jgi:uncharacterized protein (TIGR00245 family)